MTGVSHIGDCCEVMRRLIAEGVKVQMCVTSPPYWGLRDYGVPGQFGLEKTIEEYVSKMVEVCGLVRELLDDSGTLWLNLGASFCSGIIESDYYVIKRSLPNDERLQIAQALSKVWGGNASPEYAMQGLLSQRICTPGKLRDEKMPEVRAGIYETQSADGEILFAKLREVGKPHAETCACSACLHDMQQAAGTIPGGHEEKQRQERVLQCGVLVQPQSEGQSLPLGGRAERAHEFERGEVAQGGLDAGQVSLPHLPCEPETRSTSHPPVRDAQSAKVGSRQRTNSLPVVPQEIQAQGNGALGNTEGHGIGAGYGLENLTFPKSAIPPSFLAWCEPHYIFKPKDLINIPVMVAEALRRDGWYLRSDIIWQKPNPMPESVKDRPTRSHEYIFLLSKQEHYYYDADAIREPAQERTDSRPFGNAGGNRHGDEGRIYKPDKQRGHVRRHAGFNDRLDQMTKAEQQANGRNKRDVWTVATESYSGAHFATFPRKLIEPCILAGSRVGDIVLDPFFGSGTTGQVAESLGRQWIGIDINPEYTGLQKDRTQQQAMQL